VSAVAQPANLNVPPSIQVTFELTSGKADIYPGLIGNATVSIRGKANILLIPNIAIIQKNKSNFVKQVILKNGNKEVVLRKITLGLVGNSTSQVTSGLKAGDKIQLQPNLAESK
jgi:hypothetical protein